MKDGSSFVGAENTDKLIIYNTFFKIFNVDDYMGCLVVNGILFICFYIFIIYRCAFYVCFFFFFADQNDTKYI